MVKKKQKEHRALNTTKIGELDHLLSTVLDATFTPALYTFFTNDVLLDKPKGEWHLPVKVGYTNNIGRRIAEWEQKYRKIHVLFTISMIVDAANCVFSMDHNVHTWLEMHGIEHLEKDTFYKLQSVKRYAKQLGKECYYSNEFYIFNVASAEEIERLIKLAKSDIIAEYKKHGLNSHKYSYSVINLETMTISTAQDVPFEREGEWEIRPLQQEVIDSFLAAVEAGETKMLMYACMRFGKTFTALCCAEALRKKKKKKQMLMLVVSGKPTAVRPEWKSNTEKPGNYPNTVFIHERQISRDPLIIQKELDKGHSVVVFISLFRSASEEKKIKANKYSWYNQVFSYTFDITFVDETHFAARAQSTGKLTRSASESDEEKFYDMEEIKDKLDALPLKTRYMIHLSGTPHRILMTNEFNEKNIIAKVERDDIYRAKIEWDKEHPDKPEWENPYYGYAKQTWFAAVPNKRARARIQELKAAGKAADISSIFGTYASKPQDSQKYNKFTPNNEKAVSEFIDTFFGINNSDDEMLPFLESRMVHEKGLCKHMNFVLPSKASCDALAILLEHKIKKYPKSHLAQYKILNLAGFDSPYKSADSFVGDICELAAAHQKTLTLSCQKLMTGSTIPPFDTTVYIKNTQSSEEYYQTCGRTQSGFFGMIEEEIVNPDTGKTEIIKHKVDQKPNTIVIDFNPDRHFENVAELIALRARIKGQNSARYMKEYTEAYLACNPTIILNNRVTLKEASVSDVYQYIDNYRKNKNNYLTELHLDMEIDDELFGKKEFMNILNKYNAHSFSKKNYALEIDTYDNQGEDISPLVEVVSTEDDKNDKGADNEISPADNSTKVSPSEQEKRVRAIYEGIVWYTYLTDCSREISSLGRLIWSLYHPSKWDRELIHYLGICVEDIKYLRENCSAGTLLSISMTLTNVYGLRHNEAWTPHETIKNNRNNFSQLSETEFVMPAALCKTLLQLSDEKAERKLIRYIEQGNKLLDLGSTRGEIADYIDDIFCKHKKKLSDYPDAIYVVPTSTLARLMIIDNYKKLGLSTKTICRATTADLTRIVNDKDQIDYDTIRTFLLSKKDWSKIKFTKDIKNKKGRRSIMKPFGIITGNPPYQMETKKKESKNNQSTVTNIFPAFQTMADKLCDQENGVTSLIYPGGRWIQRSGKGCSKFGYEQLNSPHLETVIFYPDAKEIFKGSGLADGVSIVIKNNAKSENSFIYQYKRGKELKELNMKSPGDKFVPLYPLDVPILDKLDKFVIDNKLNYISDTKLTRRLFAIESNFVEQNKSIVSKLEEIDDNNIDYNKKIKLLTNDKSGSAGSATWYIVDKDVITTNAEYIKEWQVVVSSANAGGQQRDNKMAIIDNHSAFGRTRVGLHSFKTKREAENCIKYLQSNIMRYALMITGDRLTNLGTKVPNLPQYTENALIDFNTDIDKQLCSLIGFTKEEYEYIKNRVSGAGKAAYC